MEGYEWGDARVTYPDWQGNVQMDQKITGEVNIYNLTGVDRDEWTIIGLDWGGGEWLRRSGSFRLNHNLRVVVVPAGTDLHQAELHAKEILIHDVDPYEVIQQLTHVIDFRMRARAVLDATIVITEKGDIPEQKS